jgi:hypothetical protein
VEIFGNEDEGEDYPSGVAADGGSNWSFSGSYSKLHVTTTSTEAAGNTSGVSAS